LTFKGWPKIPVTLDNGDIVEGIAPLIVSASRSTDIPAHYSSWFFHRLEKGFIRWINPFNKKSQIVSLKKAKLIVFWSKNPQPIIPYLSALDKKEIRYVFQFTLNDYVMEKLEKGVPSLSERIATFRHISSIVGKDRIFWRFDPLILTNKISVDSLLKKIRNVGEQIAPYTSRLTISFLIHYIKVVRNMGSAGYEIHPFCEDSIEQIGKGLQTMSREWGIPVVSCAESRALDKYGIRHGACIDPYHLNEVFKKDIQLTKFFGIENEQVDLFTSTGDRIHTLKDSGQRKLCRCIVSKDVGMYDTCTHYCTYCYANTSEKLVRINAGKIGATGESLVKDEGGRMKEE
jgi:hypothetical protein